MLRLHIDVQVDFGIASIYILVWYSFLGTAALYKRDFSEEGYDTGQRPRDKGLFSFI